MIVGVCVGPIITVDLLTQVPPTITEANEVADALDDARVTTSWECWAYTAVVCDQPQCSVRVQVANLATRCFQPNVYVHYCPNAGEPDDSEVAIMYRTHPT